MSEVTFNPSSWQHAGERTTELRSAFQADTQGIIFPSGKAVRRIFFDVSPIDRALVSHNTRLHREWYNVCGNMVQKLNSDSAKFEATGATYAATADTSESAVNRFWSY